MLHGWLGRFYLYVYVAQGFLACCLCLQQPIFVTKFWVTLIQHYIIITVMFPTVSHLPYSFSKGSYAWILHIFMQGFFLYAETIIFGKSQGHSLYLYMCFNPSSPERLSQHLNSIMICSYFGCLCLFLEFPKYFICILILFILRPRIQVLGIISYLIPFILWIDGTLHFILFIFLSSILIVT